MRYTGLFFNPNYNQIYLARKSELDLYIILDMDDEALMTKTIQSVENLLKDKTD